MNVTVSRQHYYWRPKKERQLLLSQQLEDRNQEKKAVADTKNAAKKNKSDNFARSNREKSNIAKNNYASEYHLLFIN